MRMASGSCGWVYRPCWDLGLVGHEEVVEVPRYEDRRGGLLDDDGDDVLAVEVARRAEEGLVAVVVVVLALDEVGRVVAVGVERDRLREGPPREGPGRHLYVLLGVVANAHREELQQLAAVVLVGLALPVLVVVEPEDHGRVARQLVQYLVEVRQADAAECGDLVGRGEHVLVLGEPCGEYVVPEQGHLLLELAPAVQHPVEPLADADLEQLAEVVPLEDVDVDVGDALRLDEHVHNGVVAELCVLLELFLRGPESGPPHQVSEVGQSFISHRLTSGQRVPECK